MTLRMQGAVGVCSVEALFALISSSSCTRIWDQLLNKADTEVCLSAPSPLLRSYFFVEIKNK
jgi:hypothetical protein